MLSIVFWEELLWRSLFLFEVSQHFKFRFLYHSFELIAGFSVFFNLLSELRCSCLIDRDNFVIVLSFSTLGCVWRMIFNFHRTLQVDLFDWMISFLWKLEFGQRAKQFFEGIFLSVGCWAFLYFQSWCRRTSKGFSEFRLFWNILRLFKHKFELKSFFFGNKFHGLIDSVFFLGADRLFVAILREKKGVGRSDKFSTFGWVDCIDDVSIVINHFG